MRVNLLPFGVLRDGIKASTFELPEGSSVADLLALLSRQVGPASVLSELFPSIAVSVNQEYARADKELAEGDEVGLLPPVSGGAVELRPGSAIVTALTHEPILSEQLITSVKKGCDGAVVVFDGVVRDNTRGRSTLYLDYEAYEEMAEKQIAGLAAEAIARFDVRAVALVHRLGRLLIGETSVLIVVASAHRAAAYDASRWLIDTLKTTVPIWKKETFVDGVVWAAGEPFPLELVADSGAHTRGEADVKTRGEADVKTGSEADVKTGSETFSGSGPEAAS